MSQEKRDRCASVCTYRLRGFPVENPPRQSCPAHVLGCLCLGGHVSLAERDGQLQVLLLLPPQPRQPLLLCLLTFPLGPRQLLLLIAKLQRKNAGWVTWPGSCSHRPGVGCIGTGEETQKRPVKGGQGAGTARSAGMHGGRG